MADTVDRLMDADLKLAYAHRTLQRLDQFLLAPSTPGYKRTVTLTRQYSGDQAEITVSMRSEDRAGREITHTQGQIAIKDVDGEPVAGAAGSLLQEAMADYIAQLEEDGISRQGIFSGRDATKMMSIAAGAAPMSDYTGDSMDLVREIENRIRLRMEAENREMREKEKADTADRPTKGAGPINPLLLRFRQQFLAIFDEYAQSLSDMDGERSNVCDAAVNYLEALWISGVTKEELQWITDIDPDHLPIFAPPA